MSSTKRTFYVVLGLLVAIVLAYSHVWQCDFIDYDDNNHVFDNVHVRAGLSTANVVWAFTHFHASQWIPLTWISFMLDVSLFGLDPGPMHLVNVAFHFINTILLFGILWKTTGAYWRSAFVAGIFALHPINVETVAWITERKSLINTTLWLLAICCHVRYAATAKSRWVVLTAVCMAMGVMSKAMIVTLPFTLLLLDAWPLRRVPQTSWLRLVGEKSMLFALSAVACAVQISAGLSSNLLWTTEMAPIPFRLAFAATNCLHYIGAMLYPSNLAIQYPLVYEPPYGMAAVASVLIGTFLVLAWRWRVQAPYLLVGALWFLGTLVPVSGIVRAGDAVYADRYTYVPQIGLLIVVVWSVGALLERRPRIIGAAVAGVTLSLLAILTARYVTHWTDTVSLFTHAAKVWPSSARAHGLAASANAKKNNHRAAAHHYAALLKVAPGSASDRNNFGVSLSRLGNTEMAISQFRHALIDDETLLVARFNLGTHLAMNTEGAAEAIEVLTRVLQEDPQLSAAHYWLGKALEAEGRHEEARSEYQKRLLTKPSDASASAAIERLTAASLSSTDYETCLLSTGG